MKKLSRAIAPSPSQPGPSLSPPWERVAAPAAG
jgi:hypothetical protein